MDNIAEKNDYRKIPQDQELVEKLQHCVTELGGQKKVADMLGYSNGSVSMYLSGKYGGNVETFEARLKEFLETKEAAAALKSANIPGAYVPTSVSESVYNTIRLCHLKGGLSVEAGDAGIGKTMACKQYRKDYPHSTTYISANPCITSATTFLRQMCSVVGVTDGSQADMWMRLVEYFQGDRHVLICDEAQHLPIRIIEILRCMYDMDPNLGICLVGNIEVISNQSRHKESFAQIRNRTKLTEIRHTRNITEDDICKLFPAVEEKKERELLLRITHSEQALRGACNLYSNALDNEDVTYTGLVQMAKAMKIHI